MYDSSRSNCGRFNQFQAEMQSMKCQKFAAVSIVLIWLWPATVAECEDAAPVSGDGKAVSVQDMVESRTDAWGHAAMRQPNGASYEFFENLLPPLRWVNTEFRHYPIVLSAPRSALKSRVISNGSGINLRAKSPPMWYEPGTPVSFFVGEQHEPFGTDIARLKTPTYLDGYLPVVTIKYEHGGVTYAEEVFAPVDESSADHGAAMVRFSVEGDAKKAGAKKGRVEAHIDSPGPLPVENGKVLDKEGACLVTFSDGWRWDAASKSLSTDLLPGNTAELIVYTKARSPVAVTSDKHYESRKAECVRAWNDVLDRSMRLQTPEAIVNNAWRAMLIGNFMVAVGDRPHYSAQNAYAKLYEGECGDTLRSFMLFGHLDLSPAMLRPMLEFDRRDTRFHVAGHKLQLLAFFYWQTRDAETVRAYGPLWRQAVELIVSSREEDSGLLPKDRYAGDIAENVYSLNSNANCWRGLRDVAAMLRDMGEPNEATRLDRVTADYRGEILSAVKRSERLDASPPFIPNALLADEPAHDPLTATRTGSYYDLMCPYIIGSEVFGQDSDREDWLIGYMQSHGGIAMGMPRVQPAQGIYKGEPGVNPLYGLRYQLALLRRDEREKAIVGFYGQLAQGMTRGTFIGGEGSRFLHGDEHGRSFYLPPNSTSNAAWLIVLRNLLVQDWDLNGDVKPDTLRLLFAAPRRWLADGQVIDVANAPTAFGPVSYRVDSKLSEGYVDVKVTLPPRKVETMLLRMPLPDGWQISSAEIDGRGRSVKDDGVIDLSDLKRPSTIRFNVRKE
jgi:hypothetical protein